MAFSGGIMKTKAVNQSQFYKNERGMTLMEILIVLAILGSLIAILLPNLKNSQDKAKVGETKIRMGKVINQLNMYYTDCGKYPESLDNMVTADASCTNWGPEPYLKKSEAQDSWGTPFSYSVDGSNYVLKSLGADRKEGGDKFNKDISSEDIQ
jgi:general secretion pathway protein G